MQRRKFNASRKGVARNLRSEHGLSRPASEYWTDRLFNSGARCAICGLPNYLIAVYRDRGWPWFLGKRFGSGSHPRLTLDHIEPGKNNGKFRLLCHACNLLRGAQRLTDGEVLLAMRGRWRWFCGLRFLWWLNTSPGVGGRLHRSVQCQKRDAQFAAGATPESPPPTNATSTSSSSSDLYANYVG